MSTSSIPDIAPLHDFLQTQEPATLESIHRLRATTVRGAGNDYLHGLSMPAQLEHYVNQAVFDFSMRISQVERSLKSEERTEATPPEIVSQMGEMLRGLKFCSDIGNFAISQLAQPN